VIASSTEKCRCKCFVPNVFKVMITYDGKEFEFGHSSWTKSMEYDEHPSLKIGLFLNERL
jgi:hypothetical protein